MNIAIDGPAGAGKSTIAKLLARRLNFVYLDTGAMYRAIGLKVSEMGVSFNDENQISQIIDNTKIDVTYVDGVQRIFLDGADVSEKIRQHHVSKLASDISALKCVRIKLVDMQREIAAKNDTILDGRDIGTFVLPKAQFKFFLTASVDERARRRFKELKRKGEMCEFDKIKSDIAQRDYNDENRDFAPLKKADDAIELDTTKMDIAEVCEKMTKIIKMGSIK